jgi:hypothetical protein
MSFSCSASVTGSLALDFMTVEVLGDMISAMDVKAECSPLPLSAASLVASPLKPVGGERETLKECRRAASASFAASFFGLAAILSETATL